MDVSSIGVILPAGGSGERMEIETPKQFCNVAGAPVLIHTVAAFHRLSVVKFIVLVAPKCHMDYTREVIQEHNFAKVVVIEGSSTRHRSIRNGIVAVEKLFEPPEIVVVHDAVRLFAPEDVVNSVASAAKKHGAAGVIRPLISTVVRSDSDGNLVESLDRSQFRASEMPQAFQYDIIRRAYEKCDEEDLDFGTECLLLALKHCGTHAKLVEGPDSLWKVTHKKDLYAAEGILKERLCHVGVVSFRCEDNIVDTIVRTTQQKIGNSVGRLSETPDDHVEKYNSFIFVCPDDDLIFLQDKVKLLFLDRSMSGKVKWKTGDVCIVGVMHQSEESRDCEPDGVRSRARRDFHAFSLPCSKRGILLNAVLMDAATCAEAAARIAAELIQLRSRHLCGQVLLA